MNDTGTAISLMFDGGRRNLKSLIGIKVFFDGEETLSGDFQETSTNEFAHGGTVTLYARKNFKDSWTTVRTFDTKDYPDGNVRIDGPELGAL